MHSEMVELGRGISEKDQQHFLQQCREFGLYPYYVVHAINTCLMKSIRETRCFQERVNECRLTVVDPEVTVSPTKK